MKGMKTMLHTLLITHQIISTKMYDSIFKALDSISKREGVNFYPKKGSNNKTYITNALTDKGFTQISLSKTIADKKYKYPQKKLEIQLNPTKLLGRDIIELTKEEDLAEVEKRFNKIIAEQIHMDLNTFMFWTLKRIDYAVNIPTPYVKEYIKLFQRADKPHSFVIPYNDKSKDRTYKKGSFYLQSKSVKINFYDKANERLNNTGEDVESAENILRLEVQLLKGKTDAMKKSHEFDMKYLGYYLSEKISLKYINYYFDKTIGSGTYYKLDKAIKKINNSGHTQATKEKLIQVLKDINSARSIWKARDNKRYSKASFRKYLGLLRNLGEEGDGGVNPVTIPRDWDVDGLKSINIARDKM
jgi:hypothetical protein